DRRQVQEWRAQPRPSQDRKGTVAGKTHSDQELTTVSAPAGSLRPSAPTFTDHGGRTMNIAARRTSMADGPVDRAVPGANDNRRSEEHTSELQSRENLVCRLLLEKKKLHE